MNSNFANFRWISNLKNNFLKMISYYLFFILDAVSFSLDYLLAKLVRDLIGETSVFLLTGPILLVLNEAGIDALAETFTNVGSFTF